MKQIGIVFAIVLAIVATFIVASGQYHASSNLSSNNQQKIARLIHQTTGAVWFVSTAGSDTNTGLSPDSPFLTVGQAVSSASAGDVILIGPGTYDEAVDASAKGNLLIQGAGLQTFIQQSGSQNSLKIGAGTTVRSLKVESSHSTGIALHCATAADITLENLVLIGVNDALISPGDRLRVHRCYLSSTYDGANLGSCSDFSFVDSIVFTDGTVDTGLSARALITGSGSTGGQIRGCRIISRRTNADSAAAVAFGMNNSTGRYIIENTVLIAEQQHGSATGAAVAVGSAAGGATTCDILLAACHVYTSQSGSGAEYHLNQSSGTLAVDAATQYDTSKTNGTITDLAQNAMGRALIAYNLDHLMKTAVANNADMTTEVTDGTVLSNIMSATSDTSTFTVADDSLEGIATP